MLGTCPPGGAVMERLTAKDFPPELLELYDGYEHGRINRRQFLDRAGMLALGGMTALGALAALFVGWSATRADALSGLLVFALPPALLRSLRKTPCCT